MCVRFQNEFYVEGYRFVHDNITIFVHRMLVGPGHDRFRNPGHPDQTIPLATSPGRVLPSLDTLHPEDPQDWYQVEAKIRMDVENYKDRETYKAAAAELNAFKDQMKGVVYLSAPDHMLLDTRVKYTPKPVAPS